MEKSKMKKIIYTGLIVMLTKTFLISGIAFAMPDQEASDMLTAGNFSDENENADAVSRFGSSASVKKAQQPQARVMNPISENSFEHAANRGPASVTSENISRDPAGAKTAPSDMTIPSPALTRSMRKQKAYQEVAVIANDQGFFPSTLFVTQGIPVHLFITGASKRSQCFMMDSFGVRRQIRSEKIEEVSFTPDQGGTYTFNCPMNGAKGTVVVKALAIGDRLPASVATNHARSNEEGNEQTNADENANANEKESVRANNASENNAPENDEHETSHFERAP
jgi:hypothetical protein